MARNKNFQIAVFTHLIFHCYGVCIIHLPFFCKHVLSLYFVVVARRHIFLLLHQERHLHEFLQRISFIMQPSCAHSINSMQKKKIWYVIFSESYDFPVPSFMTLSIPPKIYSCNKYCVSS